MISIDDLPDDVLLAIFHFYVDEASDRAYSKEWVEGWQPLVHVCRQWRSIVFGSPRRLNLRLGCTPKTPARDLLDVWPALPLFIWGRDDYPKESVDNITAVLERSDRVRRVDLRNVPRSHLVNVSAAMQAPFPELTSLKLHSKDETVRSSRFVLEWIRPTSAIPRVERHSIFGSTKTSFVYHSPCLSCPL